MERNFASFVKFGEKKYMEKLIYEGEIFCKPISYFTKIDTKDLRGDRNDGICFIKQATNLKFSLNGKPFARSEKGQLLLRNFSDKGNIYSLFGLASDTLDLNSKGAKKLILDLDGLSFGDTAVWIYDPGEFIKRVKKVIKKDGFSVNISPISYIDFESYEGSVTPFHKSDKYKCQSEVRFWIPNKLDDDLTFKIGNISDISGIVPITMLDQLEYEPL